MANNANITVKNGTNKKHAIKMNAGRPNENIMKLHGNKPNHQPLN